MSYSIRRRGRFVRSARSFGVGPGSAVSPGSSVADQSLQFGGLTLAGAGGVAPTATGTISAAAIDSGNASGHWEIGSDGTLTPTAAGAMASLNGGPYTLDCSFTVGGETDTATITINIEADTYHVSALTDFLDTLGLPAAAKSGKTVKMRAGTYDLNLATPTAGNGAVDGAFDDLTAPMAITAADQNNTPVIPRMAVFSTGSPTTVGNVVFDNIDFDRPVDYESTENTGILQIGTTHNDVQNVTVQNCRFFGNYPRGREDPDEPVTMYGITTFRGSGVTIKDNTFERLSTSVQCRMNNMTITGNSSVGLWADAYQIGYQQVGSLAAVENIQIRNNFFGNCVGNNGLHPDFVHFFNPSSGFEVGAVNNVTIEGNIMVYGSEGHLMPPNGSHGREPVTSGNFTPVFGVEGAQTSRLYRIDTMSVASIATLPALSTVTDGHTCAIQLWDGTSGLTAQSTGGESIYKIFEQTSSTSPVFGRKHETWQFTKNQAQNRWDAKVIIGGVQGIFMNPDPASSSGIVCRYNVIWTNLAAGISFNHNTVGGISIHNNSVLSGYPGDINGDGNANTTTDAFNEWFTAGQIVYGSDSGTIKANIAGNVADFGTGNTLAGNETNDYRNDYAGFAAAFSPPDAGTAVCLPENKAQAIAYARPKAGGPLEKLGAGALGVDAADDVWDHATGALASNTPYYVLDFTVTVGPAGYDASWVAPEANGGSAITGYDLEQNVNGSGWVNVAGYDGTSTSFTQSSLSVDDVVEVRVAAINVNGTGKVSPVKSVTVTEAGTVAPTVIANSYSAIVDGTTISNYTAGTGSNRIVLGFFAMRKNPPPGSATNTTMALGGQPMTNVSEYWTPTLDGVQVFALLEADIPAGANDLVVTITGEALDASDSWVTGAVTIQDASQTLVMASGNGQDDNAPAIAATSAVSTNALAMAIAFVQNATNNIVSGQTLEGTETMSSPGGEVTVYSKPAGSAGSINMATGTGTGRLMIAAVTTEPAQPSIPDQIWSQYSFITPIEMSAFIPGAAEYRHTYNLTDTDGTTVIETGLPRGVTINNRTGRMTGAPVEAQAAASCTVWGLNAAGSVVGTQTFNITVSAHTGTIRPVSNATDLANVTEYGTSYTGPGAIIEIAAGATIDFDTVTGANYGRFTGYDDDTPLVIRSADPDNPGTITMDTRSWSFDGPTITDYGNVYFDNVTFFRPWQGSTATPGASLATSPIITTAGTGTGKGCKNIGFHNCRFYSTVTDARTKPTLKTGEMTALLFNGDSDATQNITVTSCEGYNLFNFGIFRGSDVHIENSFLRDSWGDFARIAPNTNMDADNISVVNCWHYGQTCDGLIRHADFVQGASAGGNNRTRNLDIRGCVVFANDQGYASLPAIAPWFWNANLVLASTNQTAGGTTTRILYRMECDVAAGALTVQLPDITTVADQFELCVQNYGISAHTVTALRNGSDTINGVAADFTIPGNFQAIRFFKNGASATDWTIQRYGPAMQSVNLQDDVGLIEYVSPNIAFNIFWDTLFLGIGFEASVNDGLIRHCSVIPDKPQSDIDGSGSIGPEDGAYEIISNPAFAARGGGTLTIENSFAASVFNDSGATITETNVDKTTLDQVDDSTVTNNLVGVAPQNITEAIDFARRLPGSTLPANCGATGEGLRDGPYDWEWRCTRRGDGVVRAAKTPAGNPATNILFNTTDLTLVSNTTGGLSSATPWYLSDAAATIAVDGTDTDMWLLTAGPALLDFGVDNLVSKDSGYTIDSAAARWWALVDYKDGPSSPPGTILYEFRDPAGGGAFNRITFDPTNGTVTPVGTPPVVYGAINRGNGRWTLYTAMDKPAGNTRLYFNVVRNMPINTNLKIAQPMLATLAGSTPPDFSHGPTV